MSIVNCCIEYLSFLSQYHEGTSQIDIVKFKVAVCVRGFCVVYDD